MEKLNFSLEQMANLADHVQEWRFYKTSVGNITHSSFHGAFDNKVNVDLSEIQTKSFLKTKKEYSLNFSVNEETLLSYSVSKQKSPKYIQLQSLYKKIYENHVQPKIDEALTKIESVISG